MSRLLLPALLCLCALGCSRTDLYSVATAPVLADRVALQGRVCTEDADRARFPVRVVLLVDQASGPLFGDFDPGGLRLSMLGDLVQSALSSDALELAVVGFAGRAEKLAPTDGSFTRNPGELLNGITRLSVPQPCLGEDQCRDYSKGLNTARALIESDMAELPAGVRMLTWYVVVMMTAGPHEPLALAADCCDPGDATCIEEGTEPSLACQAQLDGEHVTALVKTVEDAGAAGLRLHTLNLETGDDPDVLKGVRTSTEQMAFAARGSVHHVNHPDALRALAVGLLDVQTELVAKHLLVTNVHARATPKGPVPDSDADGLSDAEEEIAGTDPTLPDSDGDGILDRVEILVGLDALEPDRPAACAPVDPEADTDRDGLGDCDEVLVGTDPSLVDSDGDGMPDRLELYASTDYLHPDAASDPDADGIPNGDEVRHHSDPRSTDALLHLSVGYRYDVDDEGRVREAALPAVEQITGVEIVAVSQGSSSGLGTLSFDPAGPTLTWQDPADPGPGPAVLLTGPGRFELGSSSYAPIQGDEGRYVAVRVEDPGALPPIAVKEIVRVVFRDRHCLRYTVRNIRLMPTVAGEQEGGWNQLVLYFAEAPRGRLSKPGPYRLALVPVRFVPPAFRDPDGAVLTVLDEEYVNPMLSRLR